MNNVTESIRHHRHEHVVIVGVSMLVLAMFGLINDAAAADDDIATCAQEKVTFDGIKPLKYADVIGDAGAHVALNRQHPALCKSTSGAECTGNAYLVPGNTVAVSNTCGDYSHVQFIGEKKVSVGWMEANRLKERDVPDSSSASQAPKENPTAYRFKMIKGQGTPVCEAYLQRLNSTKYDQPPFCGRPENGTVPGFAVLHREDLSPQEIFPLLNHVFGFMGAQKQDQPDLVNGFDEQGRVEKKPAWTLEGVTRAMDLQVWRYSPQVDIDNDGIPDNLIVWHGQGAANSDNRCGVTFANMHDGGRVEQRAFIIKPDNIWIDEEKTKAAFGHPGDGYVGTYNEKRLYFQGFIPIGASIGIFGFRNVYYFDAFFHPDFGDFNGRRRNNRNLYDVLGVFKHAHGQTEQICEYRDHEREVMQ